MTTTIFDLIAKQHEEIVKQAVLLGAARAAGGALMRGLGLVAKNKMATFGAAMTAGDLVSGASRFSNVSAASRARPFQAPLSTM